MHPNAALIERFYTCFQALDAAGMAACYHPDAVFLDPAFGELRGPEIGAMWTMLCTRAVGLEIRFSGVEADAERGRAHWDARYTFTQTGRKVHNRIDARFLFRDGLIIRHEDTFSFWRWARQALGPVGLLLGWTPPLRGKVRSTARGSLTSYMRKAAAADRPPPTA
jgi:ketosteroid isomerase-like protein